MMVSAAEKNEKNAPRVLHYWDGPFAVFVPGGGDDFTLELADGTVTGWQRFHGTDLSHRGVVAEREGEPVKFRTWKAKPTAEQWKEFRHALDKTAVWHWEKEYFTDEIEDGSCWSLEVAFADVKVKSGGCNNAYPGPGGNPVLHPDGQETVEFKRVWAAIENLMGSKRPDLTWQEEEALGTVMPRVNIHAMTAKDALDLVWAKGNATAKKLMTKGDESLAPLEYRYDMKKHRPPVNYSAKSVTVATAFTEILKQQGLDYVVQDGNIAIVEAAKNP